MSPVFENLSKQVLPVPEVPVNPAFGDTELARKFLNINAADTLCFQGLDGIVKRLYDIVHKLIYVNYTYLHCG